jgi:D-alanine-D-alanine ligase
MGGISAERQVSLASGLGVVDALHRRGIEVIAVDAASGKRLQPGQIKVQLLSPEDERVTLQKYDIEQCSRSISKTTLGEADVVFVALHGTYGEDGRMQALLDLVGVPYTGSGMLASALAMSKDVSKRIFRDAGIPTPRWCAQPRGSAIPSEREIEESVGGYPVVVKPNDQGSTVGFSLVHGARDMSQALDVAWKISSLALVEEYIPGRELTVAVLEGRALPVVEVFPQGGVYDFQAKYVKGKSTYEVPARVSGRLERNLRDLGVRAYEALGCESVARVDFRVSPDEAVYCLEVNTIPGFTEMSLVPMAAKAAGLEYGELIERLCRDAIRRHKSKELSAEA